MAQEASEKRDEQGKRIAEVIPLKGWRKVLAERMLANHQGAAEVTQMREVDASELVKLRETLVGKLEKEQGFRLSYNQLIIKLTAQALKQHPIINSSIVGEEIRVFKDINIAMAVALDNGGLLAPVIRNTDQKSIVEVAKEAIRLANSARSPRLNLNDLSGGTFTVTNAGMYGTDFVTPLITLPQSCALGVGKLAQKPVVRDGQVVIRWVMGLSLTYDHRVVTGAVAATFFQTLEKIIEDAGNADLGIAK
jgi:pyruvate dehydrogenase E2 component (dihydrolipoamide acetyltransferase)